MPFEGYFFIKIIWIFLLVVSSVCQARDLLSDMLYCSSQQTKKDKGCSVHRLSERDSELNQKQTTYERERASILFHPLFWLVLALCHWVPRWVGFGLNKWKKNFGRSRRRQFVQVAKQREAKRRKKREIKGEKRDYSTSKHHTWLLVIWCNSVTFTSMKMSAQCHRSEQNWHSLAWIAKIQNGLKTKHIYWAWTSGGGRHPAMETSSHKADCFFPVQKTNRALASVWLASHSRGCNKTQGECSNLRMGW